MTIKKDKGGVGEAEAKLRVIGADEMLSLSLPATLVLTDKTDEKTPAGFQKVLVGGVLFAPGNILGDDDVVRLDCQIIIVPNRRRGGYKYKGTTMEIILTDSEASFAKDENWSREMPFEKTCDKGFDIEKAVEGAGKMMGRCMRESRARYKRLCDLLIPLLTPKTISKIIKKKKADYVFYKETPPSDDRLLRDHLEHLINEFDCNIHYLEDSEMADFAKTINKNHSPVFCDGLD